MTNDGKDRRIDYVEFNVADMARRRRFTELLSAGPLPIMVPVIANSPTVT